MTFLGRYGGAPGIGARYRCLAKARKVPTWVRAQLHACNTPNLTHLRKVFAHELAVPRKPRKVPTWLRALP